MVSGVPLMTVIPGMLGALERGARPVMQLAPDLHSPVGSPLAWERKRAGFSTTSPGASNPPQLTGTPFRTGAVLVVCS
jgi:hypothetical protein